MLFDKEMIIKFLNNHDIFNIEGCSFNRSRRRKLKFEKVKERLLNIILKKQPLLEKEFIQKPKLVCK